MRKALIWTGVVVVAIALGVAGAAGARALVAERLPERVVAVTGGDAAQGPMPFLGDRGPQMPPWFRTNPRSGDDDYCPYLWTEQGMPGGMMGGWRGEGGDCPYADELRRMPGGMMRPWPGGDGQSGTTPWSGRMPYGQGRMWGYQAAPSADGATRLTLDAAADAARAYAESLDTGLVVHEVMEFEHNFYAVLVEKETGRGAMEILIDPLSGAVHPEPGPNMMWNMKYGHMRRWNPDAEPNTLSLEDARVKAQAHLDEHREGAVLAEGGVAFYGYYTFDYLVEGEPAGMLSVNGLTGDSWLHNWHGAFIAETEME